MQNWFQVCDPNTDTPGSLLLLLTRLMLLVLFVLMIGCSPSRLLVPQLWHFLLVPACHCWPELSSWTGGCAFCLLCWRPLWACCCLVLLELPWAVPACPEEL
jgi:hypothetical protein